MWEVADYSLKRAAPANNGVRALGSSRPVAGEFLTTVRNFGAARLVGLITRDSRTVQLPAAERVRYDLLRGGLAAASIEISSENPALLIERATRIAKIEITPALEIRLLDETGAPVDRSVVHLDVLDPAGKPVQYYSGNVTVKDGHAEFQIPFALSDATGDWRIRGRDVISGLTEERVIRR